MAATTYSPETTRKKLLDAAAREIWKTGFRAANLDGILSKAGVTKGALYHHFKNKNELGLAVIDETIREHMSEKWFRPLDESDDPIETILGILEQSCDKMPHEQFECGCPLNNLAHEMSPIDEDFRARAESIFDEWRSAIAGAFRRGQENEWVRNNVDTEKVAFFIVSVIEGSVGVAKSGRRAEAFEACNEGLRYFLGGLRPRTTFRGVRDSR